MLRSSCVRPYGLAGRFRELVRPGPTPTSDDGGRRLRDRSVVCSAGAAQGAADAPAVGEGQGGPFPVASSLVRPRRLRWTLLRARTKVKASGERLHATQRARPTPGETGLRAMILWLFSAPS